MFSLQFKSDTDTRYRVGMINFYANLVASAVASLNVGLEGGADDYIEVAAKFVNKHYQEHELMRNNFKPHDSWWEMVEEITCQHNTWV